MIFSQLGHGMKFKILRMRPWHLDAHQERQNGRPGDEAPAQ